MLEYSTDYSQRIRFFRLCNNINDFLFQAKLSFSKWAKRAYKQFAIEIFQEILFGL